MTIRRIHVIDLGRRNYDEVLDIQRDLVKAKKAGDERDFLVLTEHPPVVTLGRTAREENLKVPRGLLRERGVEAVEVERGGDVTFHGPGQVVGYPIIDLKRAGLGIGEFLRLIEGALIECLRRFGIEARRRKGLTGVWTDQGKVAAIGIAVSRWISYHGFALNVKRDVSGFDLIIPCGLAAEDVTSMEIILNRELSTREVGRAAAETFAAALDAEVVPAAEAAVTREPRS
ncbi:MAG: lipoyl(octanoyl) transferase LipB [Planctomycetota bacterium]|jgi:lipoic acid synthetase/lipoyl(octanoyl) transferase